MGIFLHFLKVFAEKYLKIILQEMKNGLSLRQQQLHVIMYCRTRIHPRPDLTNPCAHRPPPVQVPIAVTRPPSSFREMEPPASAVSQPPGNSPEPKPPAKIEQPPETSGGYKTRSGRTVKPPDKLIEHFNERYFFPSGRVCFSWKREGWDLRGEGHQ